MDPIVIVLAAIAMLIGMIGVVVPVLPGLLIVWVVAVGTTLWVGTDAAGWSVAVVLTVLFLAGTAATIWLPARQGRIGGAPPRSFAVAALGAVVGFFVVPVVGLLLGAFGGFLLAERQRFDDWQPAFASTGRTVRAYGIGVLLELGIGVVMISIWLIAAILR